MNEKHRPENPDDGLAALNQVLDAERRVEQILQHAQSEAAQIVANARRTAAGISARGDERIQALHSCARRALKKRRQALEREFQQEQTSSDLELSDDRLDALVAQLARKLTGQSG